MANPKIKVKRSSVEGKVPAVTQLERGELAVNSYDGKVYIVKDQFSVGIATTTHTINPWNEPNGVGAGISYSGDTHVTGVSTATAFYGDGSNLTNISNIEEGNTKAEVSDTGSNGRFFIETEGTERFSVDSTGDIVLNSAHDNVFNANGNLTIDYKMYNSTKVRWLVQSSQLILYLQAGEDYPLNIWAGGDSTKDIKFFRSGDVTIGNTIKMHGPSGIVTATGGMTIGNYNMPSTIGAQDTVLKSDGTNVVFGSAASATFTEKSFTATQGQTVFTDTTALPTYVQVFVNGVKIRPTTDFSKSGASITLSSGATAGDEIDIVRFD